MVLAGVAAGCGGDEAETTTTNAPAAAATTAAPTAAATETATEAAGGEASPDSTERPDTDGDGSPDVATFRGKLGDTFILVGQPGYQKAAKDAVQVTVKKITGPFSGFNLPSGKQLIGVQVTFEGVGDEVYNNPQPHGELTLDSGETGKQTSLDLGLEQEPVRQQEPEAQEGPEGQLVPGVRDTQEGQAQGLRVRRLQRLRRHRDLAGRLLAARRLRSTWTCST